MSHIYIIYIYISVQCLSLGDPQRLKKPLKHGVLVNFPFQLSLWVEVGGFAMAQMNSRPFGLMHAFCPLLPGSLALLGNPRQKGEE